MFRKEIWESLLISPSENQFIAQWWSKRLLGIIRKRIESKQKKNSYATTEIHDASASLILCCELITTAQNGELKVA